MAIRSKYLELIDSRAEEVKAVAAADLDKVEATPAEVVKEVEQDIGKVL